jgi:repressor LexA
MMSKTYGRTSSILGLPRFSRFSDFFGQGESGWAEDLAKSVLHLLAVSTTIHLFSMGTELTAPQRLLLRFLEERSEEGEPPPTYREICERFNWSSPKAAADHVAALERKGLVTRERGCARGLRLVRKVGIPLLGHITAGTPREVLAESDARLAVDPTSYGIRDRTRAFALRVSGDSMIGRQIFDGDIVVLERDTIPRDGDVVAALIDNESTLKTFVRKREKVWLRAENPNYPDLIPAMEMQIQGVGRAVIRFLSK